MLHNIKEFGEIVNKMRLDIFWSVGTNVQKRT